MNITAQQARKLYDSNSGTDSVVEKICKQIEEKAIGGNTLLMRTIPSGWDENAICDFVVKMEELGYQVLRDPTGKNYREVHIKW